MCRSPSPSSASPCSPPVVATTTTLRRTERQPRPLPLSAATTAPAGGGFDYGYGESPPASAPAASGAALSTAESSLGTVLVDAGGLTLYAFMTDTEGVPTCVDTCAEAWPPALVEGEPTVEGVDAALVGDRRAPRRRHPARR